MGAYGIPRVRAVVEAAEHAAPTGSLSSPGLPEPTVHYPITAPSGEVIWTFDLSYPDYRLIIEYDGLQHAAPEQHRSEVGRREWMDDNDWRLLVLLAADIFKTPARTLQRIIDPMRTRGMRVPRLSDEWRQHYPSRREDIAAPA